MNIKSSGKLKIEGDNPSAKTNITFQKTAIRSQSILYTYQKKVYIKGKNAFTIHHLPSTRIEEHTIFVTIMNC